MDLESYLRFVLALIAVLGLIGLIAWAARRFGLVPGGAIGTGRGRRLVVVETMPLDGKRRLVLVRRDDREHLLLLGSGAASDLVVERDIAAKATAMPQILPAAQVTEARA
jgi:flagellar protein FliO/FliZ